jgi:hypothetical protein
MRVNRPGSCSRTAGFRPTANAKVRIVRSRNGSGKPVTAVLAGWERALKDGWHAEVLEAIGRVLRAGVEGALALHPACRAPGCGGPGACRPTSMGFVERAGPASRLFVVGGGRAHTAVLA